MLRSLGLRLTDRLDCDEGDGASREGPASSSDDPLDETALVLVRATAGEELALLACLLRLP